MVLVFSADCVQAFVDPCEKTGDIISSHYGSSDFVVPIMKPQPVPKQPLVLLTVADSSGVMKDSQRTR